MKYIVAPEFSSKLSSLTTDGIVAIGAIAKFIEANNKEGIIGGESGIEVRDLGKEIYTIKYADYRVYATFGNDGEGEYLLLLDIAVEATKTVSHRQYFSTKDPRSNTLLNPNSNMMIDPRRNMMIDPNRNMMIDPRRNRFYGGPYYYSADLKQAGFLVKANEKVTLFFDMAANFIEFGVAIEKGNTNIFDTNRKWVGYLVNTNNEVQLRFDTANRWIGFIV